MGRYKIIWTEEKKQRAIEIITEFLADSGPGECIMQSDEPQIEAPCVFARIADEVLIEGEGMVYEET